MKKNKLIDCGECGSELVLECDEHYDNEERRTARHWYFVCKKCKRTYDEGDAYERTESIMI